MLLSTFIVWLSHKLNFFRGLTWFICGLALGINSIVLGLILLAVSLVLNFLAARLEIAADRRKVLSLSPTPKPSKTASVPSGGVSISSALPNQAVLSDAALSFIQSALASYENPPD